MFREHLILANILFFTKEEGSYVLMRKHWRKETQNQPQKKKKKKNKTKTHTKIQLKNKK